MKKLKTFFIGLFSEIKYFVQPYVDKRIEVDHLPYARTESVMIDGKRYKFSSASLYVRQKGRFSFEKQYLQKNRYKVWVGSIPVNGVDTRIAFCIRHDAISYVTKNYSTWCSNRAEGVRSLKNAKV